MNILPLHLISNFSCYSMILLRSSFIWLGSTIIFTCISVLFSIYDPFSQTYYYPLLCASLDSFYHSLSIRKYARLTFSRDDNDDYDTNGKCVVRPYPQLLHNFLLIYSIMTVQELRNTTDKCTFLPQQHLKLWLFFE